jgi:hypothetical protein
MRAPATLTLLCLATCGDTAAPGFSTGPAITSVSAASGSSSTSSAGSDTTFTVPEDESIGSADTGSDTGTLRDVGTNADFGSNQPIGCKGKIDLLFVISRLGTMKTEQKQLVGSFPGFVKTIEEKLEGFDVHIMTANPDGKWPGWTCETEQWACPTDMACGGAAPGYQCGVFPDYWTPCDQELGAGLIFNVGSGAANELCKPYGGNRYIVGEEPNRAKMLECIAKVGWMGPDPPMGEALVAALAPEINDTGCNAGFLRTDALLVVVLISDTADTVSYTWPNHWYAKILAAKKDPSAVVMLGIIPQPLEDGAPVIPGCTYDTDPESPNKLRSLVEMFPNHAFGDTCAVSYVPFFDAAAEIVASACGAFVPQ